jgi:thymidylate synthase ThyX
MPEFNYLREVRPGIFHLSHQLRPEVRAMFCAMASRIPVGGIQQRYREVVGAIEEDMRLNSLFSGTDAAYRWRAEVQLTGEGPLPGPVQKFFDTHVGKYGHSSVLELTGDPAIFVEGCSWYAAWLAFDSPLCAGQEMSTRAIRRKDWPMCREIEHLATEPQHAELYERIQENHQTWMGIFNNEVEAWKQQFSSPEVREMYGIQDKEPFRPALDRARWALPGSIATAFSQTGNLRERSRAIHLALTAAASESTEAGSKLWQHVFDAYEQAMPGMKGLGLREAVYSGDRLQAMPSHLCHPSAVPSAQEVWVRLRGVDSIRLEEMQPYKRQPKQYADPILNRLSVDFRVQCSLAVSRDWHRHRTFMPWSLSPQFRHGEQTEDLAIALHPAYESITLVSSSVEGLLRSTAQLWQDVSSELGTYMAMLVLPFGTSCTMRGSAGLRDFLYAMELRAHAHGANFEYKKQALEALEQLRLEVGLELELGVTIARALYPAAEPVSGPPLSLHKKE